MVHSWQSQQSLLGDLNRCVLGTGNCALGSHAGDSGTEAQGDVLGP